MSAGFFKLDPSGELLYGEIITGDGYGLTPYERDQQIHGWAWFESDAEARAAYGIVPAKDDLVGQVEYLSAKVETLMTENAMMASQLVAIELPVMPL